MSGSGDRRAVQALPQRAVASGRRGLLWVVTMLVALIAAWSQPATAQDARGGVGVAASRLAVPALGAVAVVAQAGDELDYWVDKLAAPERCWACTMYGVVTSQIVKVGRKASSDYSDDLVRLVGALLVVWILVQLARINGLIAVPMQAGGLTQGIVNSLFIFLILIGVFRAGNGGVFGLLSTYLIGPLFDLVAEVGVQMLTDTGLSGGGCSADVAPPAEFARGMDLVCAMHLGVSKPVAYGVYMMTSSVMSRFEFLRFVAGGVLAAVFFFLALRLMFMMFDALVQMAALAFLAPFLVACWQFRSSRGLSVTGLRGFVGSVLTIFFMAVTLAVTVNVMTALSVDGAVATSAAPSANLAAAVTGESTEQLRGVTVEKFVALIALAVGLAGTLQKGVSFAQQFAQTRIGDGVGEAAWAKVGAMVNQGAQLAGSAGGTAVVGAARGASALAAAAGQVVSR